MKGDAPDFGRFYTAISAQKLDEAFHPGEYLPAPHEWVQQRTGFKGRFRYTTLSKMTENWFPASVRRELVDFIAAWPRHRESGVGIIIAGNASRGELTGAGAALVNEIVGRYGERMPLTVAWLSPGAVREITDARSRGSDLYMEMKKRPTTATLLLVDDLWSFISDSDGRNLLADILEARYDNRRPTVLSYRRPLLSDGDWSALEKNAGERLAEFLRDNNHVVAWREPDTPEPGI